MTSLPRFSVNNPVLINLLMVAIIVGGIYSAMTMVREMFPESRPQQVMVTTLYPGATPAEVEKGITLKIEEQVKDLDGVEHVRSEITEGRSVILIELESGYKAIDQAVNDVKAAIDTIPVDDFPEEALESNVIKFEPRFPVISVSLYGDVDDRTLKDLGERLRSDILALPGISEVTLSGTRKDEISIEVRPEKLAEYNLSFIQVAEAVAASNLDLPGGEVRTPGANVAVRTLGEKDRGEQMYDIVVRSDADGGMVRLRDVAAIIDGFEDVEVTGRLDALPSVSVVIYKTPDQDAMHIASLARALVAGKTGRPLERSWTDRMLARLSRDDPVADVYEQSRHDPYPRGVGVKTRMDLSRLIEDRLDLLKRNGLWGLTLVFLSLLLFLHWRVAFWVMMGLLLAIGGSLVCMRLLGQTLNLMTMGGFIIVLGLLVDDAIIVSENVYTKLERGLEPKLAAIEGAEEVTWPVTCAILTTIVAFVPLRFIEGQIGDWMGVLPVVICVALSVSLFEALTILPSHLAHNLRPRMLAESGLRRNRFGAIASPAAFLHGLHKTILRGLLARYERLLRLATQYRYVTMGALCACALVAAGTVAGGHVPWVLIQKEDAETVMVQLDMTVGAPVEDTRRAAGVIERAALGVEGGKSVYTLVGIQVSEEGIPSPPQSHLGQVFLELVPSEERSQSSDEIIQTLRVATGDIPGAEKVRYTAVHGGPGGAPIHLEIRGRGVDDLLAVSDEIKGELAKFDGVYDIADDFDAGRPEVQIELLDSARALGLTTASLATQVRAAFYGFEARKVQRGREDVKIMVRYPESYRTRIYDIESMRIATPSGALVPFTEVARLTEGTGFASLHRTDQLRTVTVKADVDDTVTNSSQVMAAIAERFPKWQRRFPGVQFEYGGQQLEMAKSFGSLRRNFVIALVLIFVILAGLFRSYAQPMIVMAVIPFGLIGAIAGHLVMGYPMTIASRIGLVALTGVVVNDALVLVSFINRRREDGDAAYDAVIAAGMRRLRPILLTSATTVLGMAPLLLETSWQAKFLIPMGISVSAGLIFATVLTLIVVPSLYLIVIDIKHTFAAAVAWLTNGRYPAGVSG